MKRVIVTGLILWYKIVTPLRNWNKKWEVVENRVERLSEDHRRVPVSLRQREMAL